MYYRPRYNKKPSSMGFLMPFVIIIVVGIIGILLYKVWTAFTGSDIVRAAYMHVDQGTAEMKTWGTEQFFSVGGDTVLMQGDEVSTASEARAIVEMLDGTILRLGGSTDIVFEEIDLESDEPSVTLMLLSGNVWVNKVYRDTASTKITVKMADTVAFSTGKNIFEVESNIDDVVRVLIGEDVSVDVMDAEGKKAVETEVIGVGQEARFTDAALDRYWQFQSPNVVIAISDEFKQTPWYEWNKTEDRNPMKFEVSADGTQLIKVEPQVIEDAETTEEGEVATEDGTEETEDTEQTKTPTLAAPTLSSVQYAEKNAEGVYVTKNFVVVLKGGVPQGAAKVTVNDFVLQKFKAGDTNWSYFANANYGYMKEGENTYEVVVEDASGAVSAKLTVKVLYQPDKAVTAPATTETPAETTPAATETPATTPAD